MTSSDFENKSQSDQEGENTKNKTKIPFGGRIFGGALIKSRQRRWRANTNKIGGGVKQSLVIIYIRNIQQQSPTVWLLHISLTSERIVASGIVFPS